MKQQKTVQPAEEFGKWPASPLTKDSAAQTEGGARGIELRTESPTLENAPYLLNDMTFPDSSLSPSQSPEPTEMRVDSPVQKDAEDKGEPMEVDTATIGEEDDDDLA